MIYAFGSAEPAIDPSAFVHPDAVVIGAATIGPKASIWPTAVLRADFGLIEIGAGTSIQDGTVLHTTREWPTLVGARCIVGHNAHLEGCRVGDGCLIGSGSIVLNRAVVESGAGVGAAALVPEDFTVPAGRIALGVPAKLRELPADFADFMAYGVEEYTDAAARYRRELRRLA